MPRFFALPVLAVVISLVGFRWLAEPAPAPRTGEAPEIVVSLPLPEPEAAPEKPLVIVAPQELWQAPAPPAPRIEPPAAPAPAAVEPPAPVVRTEVVERTVYVPQTTVIYAPTTIINNTVVTPAPEPRQEIEDYPAIWIAGPAPAYRPHPKRCETPTPQQDPFFKTIPFMPPTPRSARWNP